MAVEGLSIAVEYGEVLGFLGPNGAGKTTTIRMLAGIIAPTEGYAVVAGMRTDRDVERLHELIGLLTEVPGFYNRLTSRENLRFFARFYLGMDADAQADKYLKLMELWERRDDKVGSFSKGMKQRLALARALLHEPKVLLLDEPTAGLDPESAWEVRRLILKLKEQGRTIFLSTHNLEEAEQLCDRIAVIRTRLVVLDTPEDLRERLFRRQVVVELESVEEGIVDAVGSLGFVCDVREDGNRLVVELEEFDRNRPELVRRIVERGGKILGVSEKRHSLEEAYLRLMSEEGNGP